MRIRQTSKIIGWTMMTHSGLCAPGVVNTANPSPMIKNVKVAKRPSTRTMYRPTLNNATKATIIARRSIAIGGCI